MSWQQRLANAWWLVRGVGIAEYRALCRCGATGQCHWSMRPRGHSVCLFFRPTR